MTPVQRPPVEPLFYTPEEAAIVLGMSRWQVYKLIARGELAAARIGNLRRIPRKHLTPEMLVKLSGDVRRASRRQPEATT
jgi:excisionase family DNA binding protein